DGHLIYGAHLLWPSQNSNAHGKVFLCRLDVEDHGRCLTVACRLGRGFFRRGGSIQPFDLAQAVAGGKMLRLSPREGPIGETTLVGKAAARAKAAPRGGVEQVRRCSIDRRQFGGATAIEPRYGAQ